jgi:xanthine/CO dehydrogenase XdhC/CoxF family maturation factor
MSTDLHPAGDQPDDRVNERRTSYLRLTALRDWLHRLMAWLGFTQILQQPPRLALTPAEDLVRYLYEFSRLPIPDQHAANAPDNAGEVVPLVVVLPDRERYVVWMPSGRVARLRDMLAHVVHCCEPDDPHRCKVDDVLPL